MPIQPVWLSLEETISSLSAQAGLTLDRPSVFLVPLTVRDCVTRRLSELSSSLIFKQLVVALASGCQIPDLTPQISTGFQVFESFKSFDWQFPSPHSSQTRWQVLLNLSLVNRHATQVNVFIMTDAYGAGVDVTLRPFFELTNFQTRHEISNRMQGEGPNPRFRDPSCVRKDTICPLAFLDQCLHFKCCFKLSYTSAELKMPIRHQLYLTSQNCRQPGCDSKRNNGERRLYLSDIHQAWQPTPAECNQIQEWISKNYKICEQVHIQIFGRLRKQL